MLPLLANLKIFNGIGLSDGFTDMNDRLTNIDPLVKKFFIIIEKYF